MQATYQVLPPLRDEEYAALKADIAKRGVLIPVEVDEATGEVLDGHHRLRACGELGIEPPVTRRHLNGTDPVEHALKLNLLRRHMNAVEWAEAFHLLKSRRIDKAAATVADDSTIATVSVENLALEVGVKPRTARYRLQLLDLPEPLKDQIREGERTPRTALQEHRRQQRIEQAEGRERDGSRNLPDKRGYYQTIVIDPPWQYDRDDIRGAAEHHYDTLSFDEIAALPVGDFAQADAHLYVWVTNPHLPEVWRIVSAWGFDYKTLITWVKPDIGTGHYFRGATEHVLFCIRGTLPPRDSGTRNWFEAPRTEHSTKPQAFYDVVERVSYGPYLEMFARRARDGWDSHGDEA